MHGRSGPLPSCYRLHHCTQGFQLEQFTNLRLNIVQELLRNPTSPSVPFGAGAMRSRLSEHEVIRAEDLASQPSRIATVVQGSGTRSLRTSAVDSNGREPTRGLDSS